MKKNDIAYIDLEVGKKKEVRACRCVVQEVHGAVARVQVWDGKTILSKNVMIRDLRKEP
jgi:hypothetical protein